MIAAQIANAISALFKKLSAENIIWTIILIITGSAIWKIIDKIKESRG